MPAHISISELARPPRFLIHDSSTAVGAAAERLAELEVRHGQVGTMVATMAGSPSVLAGYLDLSRAMKRTKLTRAVSERISRTTAIAALLAHHALAPRYPTSSRRLSSCTCISGSLAIAAC